MAATRFKRGQTFSYAGQLLNDGTVMDFTGWAITSQLRTAAGALVQDLASVFLDPATGMVELSATPAETEQWPVDSLLMDVRLRSPAGQVVISGTVVIKVEERQTHA